MDGYGVAKVRAESRVKHEIGQLSHGVGLDGVGYVNGPSLAASERWLDRHSSESWGLGSRGWRHSTAGGHKSRPESEATLRAEDSERRELRRQGVRPTVDWLDKRLHHEVEAVHIETRALKNVEACNCNRTGRRKRRLQSLSI
jgi:hypothetical protein